MAAGSRVAVTLFFGLVLLLLPEALVSHLVSGSLDTNEIVDAPLPEELDLPQCRSSSACGYLQVNAFGVNSRQFCSCGRGQAGGRGCSRRDCGLHWDPEDGRSVTMGNQQFKGAGLHSSLPLPQVDLQPGGRETHVTLPLSTTTNPPEIRHLGGGGAGGEGTCHGYCTHLRHC
ncbi:hypothetical protein Pcinc_018973 [Petrolisthes cinctipes]|uniref:EGF-like domain-containing protein n=1 Tax=Petrolisthes cinctipes TaxID=88211 RepID=A0AAE1FL38_PETCI|nr:hypothetical protein Pcinc_018973 [Petrolisthes cinctipes]